MGLRWRVAQFAEGWWWRFYLAGKEKNNYLHNKRIYWQKQLDACGDVLKIQTGDTIADVGCGPAGVFIMFPEQHVVAADPLLDQYEATLPHFRKTDYPYVEFITSPIETFESNERFDVVFCMNAINHVRDIQLGFQKLANLTSENGTLVVSIDAHNKKGLKKIFRIGPGDILHPHQYDMFEYISFIEKQGFSVVKTVLLSESPIFNHYILIANRHSKMST